MNETEDGWSLTIADPEGSVQKFDISNDAQKAQAKEVFDRLLNQTDYRTAKGRPTGFVRQDEVSQVDSKDVITEDKSKAGANQFVANNNRSCKR